MINYAAIKRIFDFVSAFVLFVLSFPVSLIVAVAIKIESPNGPIFADIPDRVGLNGRHFRFYKFRSMIPNAHYILRNDPQMKELLAKLKKNSYKLVDDPRITRVGKFIRKYSLDEIPQFINVMKGDMSLIGPRPYYPDELETQQQEYPHTKHLVKEALSVRPGITGEWQVSGRSQINFDKRIEMDARYANNLSLWYDFKILIKTPFAMLSGKGAY